MGLTSGGLPSTDNYVIGRGILRLDLFDTSGAATGQYRDLGNCTNFALTLEEETLDHEASLTGLKKIDASVTLSKSLKGSFTLDEITSENQQLFFSGTHAERAQTALTRLGASSLNEINWIQPANSAGLWLPVYYDNTGTPRFDVRGSKDRGYQIDITQVDINGGASDLAEGTHWAQDKEAGLFQALVGGSLDSASPINVELDIAFKALTGATVNNKLREVLPLDRTVIRGRLAFVGENAQTGAKYEVFLNKVKITADGDASFIGDEFSELPFTFTAETDEAYDSVAPTGRITRIPTEIG